ncbi:hypothetical protein [Paenibacillus sp. GCM10027629]|uniref:hypothetical protein n=1 Tax=Paenibacillus sp. GCM10027629 TaxID=3273414 RepID=UPI0036D23869
MELKDGNSLNEVRMLCNSMMENNNRMKADKTIKYKPDKSILKYNFDDEIKLSKDDFLQLAKAFFADIEFKFL